MRLQRALQEVNNHNNTLDKSALTSDDKSMALSTSHLLLQKRKRLGGFASDVQLLPIQDENVQNFLEGGHSYDSYDVKNNDDSFYRQPKTYRLNEQPDCAKEIEML